MKVLKAAPPALTLLLLPARANASTLPAGSGSFTSTVEITSVRQADGNTIIAGVEVQTLTGLFTGTRVASGIEIVHAAGTFEASLRPARHQPGRRRAGAGRPSPATTGTRSSC